MKQVHWRGIIAFEGEETLDGRIVSPGALQWPRLPVPLAVFLNVDQFPAVIGTVDRVWRDETAIRASGSVDPDSLGALRGIAIDVDGVTGMPDLGTNLRLRRAVLTTNSAWPDARIEVLGDDDEWN